LLGMGQDRKEEQAALSSIDLDAEGLRAVAIYEVWALDIVRAEHRAGALSAPIHAQLNDKLCEIGGCVKRLYAYSFQVLPFIYTHLVSTACTFFLVINAFLKGLDFTPDSSLTFGFVMPMMNVLLITLSIFGLLEVGDTILNPFGTDPEDLAITHMVEWTAVASFDAIVVSKRKGVRERSHRYADKVEINQYAFNSSAELHACVILSTLVARWKLKKLRAKKERQAEKFRGANIGVRHTEPPVRGPRDSWREAGDDGSVSERSVGAPAFTTTDRSANISWLPWAQSSPQGHGGRATSGPQLSI